MYGNGFFNPYMYQPYYQASSLASGLGAKSGIASLGKMSQTTGVLKSILGKFSFSGFLNGASKTLNVVNQAIPIFYQVKPMFNNAKTMFRIMGAMKDDDNKNTTTNNIQSKNISNQSTKKELNTISNYQTYQEENPTFFI